MTPPFQSNDCMGIITPFLFFVYRSNCTKFDLPLPSKTFVKPHKTTIFTCQRQPKQIFPAQGNKHGISGNPC